MRNQSTNTFCWDDFHSFERKLCWLKAATFRAAFEGLHSVSLVISSIVAIWLVVFSALGSFSREICVETSYSSLLKAHAVRFYHTCEAVTPSLNPSS